MLAVYSLDHREQLTRLSTGPMSRILSNQRALRQSMSMQTITQSNHQQQHHSPLLGFASGTSTSNMQTSLPTLLQSTIIQDSL